MQWYFVTKIKTIEKKADANKDGKVALVAY
jgi:hypothetical protein